MKNLEQIRVIRRKLYVKIDGTWCLLACGVTNTMYAEKQFATTVRSSIFANRWIFVITFDHIFPVRRYVVDDNNVILQADKLTAEQILEIEEDTRKRIPELIEDDIEYLEKLDKETFTFPDAE